MYEEGMIFEGMYPPEAAQWCNDSGMYHIEEIEPVESIRRFQIADNEPYIPSAEDKVATLKAQLSATDYVVIKIMEGAASMEEYADVIAQRQIWREQINLLEEAL